MKKLFLALFLCLAFAAKAQTPYQYTLPYGNIKYGSSSGSNHSFFGQVYMRSIPASSSTTDSVVVVINGQFKKVPRTQFSTGTVTSVTGTSNRITSTGGTTPVIDISASYVGQSSITTLGTITTGLWNGSVIPSNYGGAGSISGLLKANGSGVVSQAVAGTDYLAPGGSGSGLSGVMLLTGNQTASGVKTLSDTLKIKKSGSSIAQIISVGASTAASFDILRGDKNGAAFVRYGNENQISHRWQLGMWQGGGNKFYLQNLTTGSLVDAFVVDTLNNMTVTGNIYSQGTATNSFNGTVVLGASASLYMQQGNSIIYNYPTNTVYSSYDNGSKKLLFANGESGGTFGLGSNFTVSSATGALTGTTGTFTDGSQGLIVRAYTGGAGYGAIYSSGVTPNNSNYAFATGTASTIIRSNSGKIGFETNNTETAILTSAGFLKTSNNGTFAGVSGNYHELRSNQNQYTAIMTNTNATGSYGLQINLTGLTQNNTTNTLIEAFDNSISRFTVYTNGGVANFQANNVNLSDERAKKNISKAGSYWNVIKAIEFDSYKYKNQKDNRKLLGVMAQQIESVYPDWVNDSGLFGKASDGSNLKAVYEQQLQYGVNIVVQESMKRIEALEAEVKILKSK